MYDLTWGDSACWCSESPSSLLPPPSLFPSHHSTLATLDCSAHELQVGGHAAAFTSPPAFSSHPCGMLDSITANGPGDSTLTPTANVLSALPHPGTIHAVLPPPASDSGASLQHSSAAITSIFDRSAILCNRKTGRPVDDLDTRAQGAGKIAAKQMTARSFNIEGLSAQALASERGTSISAARRALSLAKPRANKLDSRQVASVPAALHDADDDITCPNVLGPGWVLEAPQGEQPGHASESSLTP